MKAPYLVCYDISDEKRLNRLFKYMKGKGLHLQYSVFYCIMTWKELNELKGDISGIIDSRKDDVRIYPLQEDSLVASFGLSARIPEGIEIFL